MPARTSGVFSPGSISRWTDTSDDLFTASLDFLPGCKEAIDEQPEQSDVHANEKHHVHDLVATCSLIGRTCKPAYPSEDSIQALDRHRYQNQVLNQQLVR